ARELVTSGPELVARALEAKHRLEDVERHKRFALRRVRRSDRLERGGGPGLIDTGVHDLPGLRFLVGQHEVAVNRQVVLALRVEDLGAGEDRVETKGAGLV